MSEQAVLPQLTLRAVVLAIVLAVILAAANTYLGLFAGMTVASAIPAAVVSMAVLRVLGGGHILENNIVQTGGAAGAARGAGVNITMTPHLIHGAGSGLRYRWGVGVAGRGGIDGVVF
jgi:putative OPT family oligopeptide transporter